MEKMKNNPILIIDGKEMKKCIGECGKIKILSEFRKNRNKCKKCESLYVQNRNKNNPEYMKNYNKLYYQKNKEKEIKRAKIWNDKNPEKSRNAIRNWEKNNPEKVKQSKKKWEENNPNYIKNKRKNIYYKLHHNISTSINASIKRKKHLKNGISCLKYLSYTIKELKKYLESLFETWMNWDNYGIYNPDTYEENPTWQIDHIVPHSFFHYTSMDCQEFKDCWSLSNLRPISSKENIKNGNKRNKNQINKIKEEIKLKLENQKEINK